MVALSASGGVCRSRAIEGSEVFRMVLSSSSMNITAATVSVTRRSDVAGLLVDIVLIIQGSVDSVNHASARARAVGAAAQRAKHQTPRLKSTVFP
jgi:hypothetical protein